MHRLRTIGRLRAGGSGFNPLTLFAAGEQGAWYDPSDLSTQFQDSAGTTPVTAAGQPVGKVLDKSGRGNHSTQATAASRPTLQQPTYYSLREDGVDDSLAAVSGGGGTLGILLCAAITPGGAGTIRDMFDDRGTTSGYIVRLDASDKLVLIAGNGSVYTSVATASTVPAGETHVITVWEDGVNLNTQIDNGAVASIARPVVAAGSAGFSLFKNNTAASEFFNGDCQQLVYLKNTAKSAAERAALKTYVGRKAGLAL